MIMKTFLCKGKSRITISLFIFILLTSPVLSQTFDFNTNTSGNGTQNISQIKESNTLIVKSEGVNLCLKSVTDISSAYEGFTGSVVTTNGNCIKNLTISLQSGEFFNLDKIDIQERHCSVLNLVLTAKSGSDVKGSVTISFTPSQGKTIDLSANTYFKNITSVEITSATKDACCGDYTYWIALDNVVLGNVHQPLGVSSVTPDNGPVTGGTSVTVGGTGFQYVQAVKFGSADAKSFTVNSATSITAVSPAASAGTVDVTVITANGASEINDNDKFIYHKISQTITFDNPGDQTMGTTPELTATATSGLVPVFTSATTDVCTITTGGTLTLLKPGSCTINAGQAGNDTYLAAPTVSQTFEVISSVPGKPTHVTATPGNAQATVSFTTPASDGGSAIIKYIVKSNDGIIAEGTSTTITVTGLTNGTSYTFTVTAINAKGEGPASDPSNSVTPTCDQTISFNNPGDQVYGSTVKLTATATSGLPVTFISMTTDVCTVSGDEATFKSAGACTISARQEGNHAFNPAPPVEQSFNVNPKTLTIVGLSAEDKIYDGTTVATLTGTAVLTGVVLPDNVTLSGTPSANFADAGIGTTKPVTVTGYTLTGDASVVDNYTLQQPTGLTANITRATVVLSWNQPADITYGTALGNAQLNATSNISGTFAYTPAAGTILNAGSAQTLSVTFTPADLINYQVVSKNVTINVSKAPLNVVADNIQITFGSAIPPLTYQYSGFVNGENSSVLDAQPVISVESTPVNAGTYPIVVSGGSDNNYSFNYLNGTLTITKAVAVLSWDSPADITYGTALGNAQLNATSNISGTFTYTPAAGTILNAGSAQTLSVTFTPADLINYQVVSKNVTISVTKAPLNVVADNIQITYGSAVPPLTYQYSGFVNGENSSVLDSQPVISVESTPENAGTYSIVVSGGSDNNYSFNYVNGTLTINPLTLSIGTPVLTTSKTYNGNNLALVTPGAISGVPAGKDVHVEASAIYDNANVGTGKTITVSYVLTGADKGNYQTPANYVVNTGVITAKQLTITDPVVVKSKDYDGNTVASITSVGQLNGVVAGDEGNVSVSASANYNDASVSNNKTITVVYTLTGSAAGNYLAPVNNVITDASIVLKLSLSLENPKAGCDGGALQLPFTIIEGSANSYRIVFADAALAAGFSNSGFTQLPSGNVISISIPKGVKDGTYDAFLQVKNDIISSELYKFTFTINLTSGYLVKKFNDVILVDNSSNRFTSYQWYKNGTIINGARDQFYNDLQGLSGTYHAVVTTVSGQTLEICPVTYNVATIKAMVSLKTYPNPAFPGNTIKIEIEGLSDEQLKGAVLSVFSNRGEKISSSAKVETVNTIASGNNAGIYFVRLATADGNVITQKITITQ